MSAPLEQQAPVSQSKSAIQTFPDRIDGALTLVVSHQKQSRAFDMA